MYSLQKIFYIITFINAKQTTQRESNSLLRELFGNYILLGLIILIIVAIILIAIYLAIRMWRYNEYGSARGNSYRSPQSTPKRENYIEIEFNETDFEEKDYFNISNDNPHTPNVDYLKNKNKENFVMTQSYCSVSTKSSIQTHVLYCENFNSEKGDCNTFEKDIKSMEEEKEQEIIYFCTVIQVYGTTPYINLKLKNMVTYFINMKCTVIQVYGTTPYINFRLKNMVTYFINMKCTAIEIYKGPYNEQNPHNLIYPQGDFIKGFNNNQITVYMLENKITKTVGEKIITPQTNVLENKNIYMKGGKNKIRMLYVRLSTIRRLPFVKKGELKKKKEEDICLYITSNNYLINLLEENNQIVYEESEN